MKPHSLVCVVLFGLGLVGSIGSAYGQQVDYSKIQLPETFIFPPPREATYGPLDVLISGPVRADAVIVLPDQAAPVLQAAAEDLNAALLRLAPQVQPLSVATTEAPEQDFSTIILLGPVGKPRSLDTAPAAEGLSPFPSPSVPLPPLPSLDAALAAEGLTLTPTDPGPQGYCLAVREEGGRKVVLLAGCDEQGAYWAVQSFIQLLRRGEDGRVRAYRARVRDWPGFAVRMNSVEAVYESKHNGLASMKDRMSVWLGMKYNRSFYSGDSQELNAWLKQRGYQAGTGYWILQHIGRKAAEWGLKPANWGDERILQAWTDYYRQNAASRPGLLTWHDCTDAGWFNKYLDVFWANREESDQQKYPQEHPGLADAERFNAIYHAIKEVSPDTEVYFTVPCYYDTPENDQLPRIDLFRDYLRTLGRLCPKDLVWILEDRGPAQIAAYQHYLEGRCLNYRYPLPGGNGPWSTNFTAAKHAVRYSDAYFFCTGHYLHDLLTAGGAAYMWNPDLPDDYPYIAGQLVPQVGAYLYGGAWREMAQFLVHLNIFQSPFQRG